MNNHNIVASTIEQKSESSINKIIDDNINNININGNMELKKFPMENNLDAGLNSKANGDLANSFNTKNMPSFKTTETYKIHTQTNNKDSISKNNLLSEKTSPSSRKRSAEDFKFLECIGEGSYSKVYRAVSKKNVHTYAIKILNKQHIHKEKKRKYVTIEKNTLNVLGKHPGIVTLYYTFQDPKSLYFVIDFAQNGELLNLMHKLGSLSVELSRYYAVQLIDTISFIHGRGIIHRDLKPENILLGSDWKLMITDFGAAKFIDLPAKNGNDLENENENNDENSIDNNTSAESLGSFVGTAEYISPELLKYNQSSFASDYWSLGCIIYQMFVGIPPFKAANEYETFERIVDLIYAFPDPHKFPIPSCVVDLVQNLLVEDPKERLGSADIKQHSWFKDIDWNDDSNIWGPVPKLEPYRPEKYFKIKRTSPVSQSKSVPAVPQQQQQKVINSKVQSNPIVPPVSQIKSLHANTVSKSSVKRLDYVNDKSRTALKKQIMNAQNNTQLMNKVNNRINEKGGVITKRTQTSNIRSTHVLPSVITSHPVSVSSPQIYNQLSSFDVSKKRLSNGKTINNLNSPIEKKKISRNNSLSSLSTTGDSAKSVIIKSSTPNTTPSMIPLTTFSSNNTVKRYSNLTDNKTRVNKTNNNNNSQTKSVASSPLTNSPNMGGNKKSFSSKSGYNQLPLFVQKPRVTSSDAATAAAGAIGTLLTHKRHLNSTSSTDTQYKQLQNHQKQLINPVLLDRQIPSIIRSKLMQHETILKLDNIFKSEISHKANQFTAPGETLNHEILENIIRKYDRELSKDLKACVMVITSYARLFIYELNDDFRLHNPQSLTQIQALDFYLKIIEIKLTNKNVSLYDYEFDEEMHEGYLILELANVNKLVFLSAWDRSRLIKGGINSNVRVGFHVNENESWVKSFLKAKDLLKKREAATHNNLNKKSDYNKLNKSQGVTNDNQTKSQRSGSTSSMHQSFRKLKINTHSKIRSLSSSSGKDNSQSSYVSSSPSMPLFSSTINNDIERRQSSSSSQNGSLLSGVKELAMGVKAGFKGKDNAIESKRIRSNSDRAKDISDMSDYSGDEVIEMNEEQLNKILKLNNQNQNFSNYKNNVTNNSNHRQLTNRKSVPKLTSEVREREISKEISKEKTREIERKDNKAQNHFFTYPAKKESKAAIAAAMAVGKKR